MAGALTLDAMQKHYEGLALELEENIPEFEYLTLCLDANFGDYEFCTGSLGLDLYVYARREYLKVDLGEVKLISKAELLSLWHDKSKPRYEREKTTSSAPKTVAKPISLTLDDLDL